MIHLLLRFLGRLVFFTGLIIIDHGLGLPFLSVYWAVSFLPLQVSAWAKLGWLLLTTILLASFFSLSFPLVGVLLSVIWLVSQSLFSDGRIAVMGRLGFSLLGAVLIFILAEGTWSLLTLVYLVLSSFALWFLTRRGWLQHARSGSAFIK